jgi:hypothetical protein
MRELLRRKSAARLLRPQEIACSSELEPATATASHSDPSRPAGRPTWGHKKLSRRVPRCVHLPSQAVVGLQEPRRGISPLEYVKTGRPLAMRRHVRAGSAGRALGDRSRRRRCACRSCWRPPARHPWKSPQSSVCDGLTSAVPVSRLFSHLFAVLQDLTLST